MSLVDAWVESELEKLKRARMSKDLCENGQVVAKAAGKGMTTRQVAEALGVDPRSVQRIVKGLYPELVSNGLRTILNVEQATAVKNKLGTGRNDLDNVVEVKNKLTSVDIERMTLQVIAYHQNRIAELERENERQQIELDAAEDWWTVKRVLLETGKEYPWRPLKRYSKEHGYEMPKAFDKNYGEVNAYHVDVWNKVYGLEL